jgi:hypothetical protein
MSGIVSFASAPSMLSLGYSEGCEDCAVSSLLRSTTIRLEDVFDDVEDLLSKEFRPDEVFDDLEYLLSKEFRPDDDFDDLEDPVEMSSLSDCPI